MTVGRDGHTATLLSDGRVLIAGGSGSAGDELSSAELYDPRTGQFSPTGSMGDARFWHTASLLSDGRVLITGGYDFYDFTGTGIAVPGPTPKPTVSIGDPDPLRIAEVYDPETGTFSRTGSMAIDRYLYTATLLRDGRVLIAGGYNLKLGAFASAELYDPKTGKFTTTGSMSTSRTGHTATLLPNGQVLITGGYSSAGLHLDSAELYDPSTGKFRPTGSMSITRTDHTATLLADGRVLIAGGFDESQAPNGLGHASAEIYDPNVGTFSPTGSMTTGRSGHTATLLANGHVLLTGGDGRSGEAGDSAELYDPTTGSFSPTDGMDAPYDTATRLSDGSVLMTGGSIGVVGGSEALATAELYRP